MKSFMTMSLTLCLTLAASSTSYAMEQTDAAQKTDSERLQEKLIPFFMNCKGLTDIPDELWNALLTPKFLKTLPGMDDEALVNCYNFLNMLRKTALEGSEQIPAVDRLPEIETLIVGLFQQAIRRLSCNPPEMSYFKRMEQSMCEWSVGTPIRRQDKLPKEDLDAKLLPIRRAYNWIYDILRELRDRNGSTINVSHMEIETLAGLALPLILNNASTKGAIHELNLSSNKLKQLPACLTLSLEGLTTLNLASNKFEHFPKEVTVVKALAKLIINDNPFVLRQEEIAELLKLLAQCTLTLEKKQIVGTDRPSRVEVLDDDVVAPAQPPIDTTGYRLVIRLTDH